mgnify:CR=1 FL=1
MHSEFIDPIQTQRWPTLCDYAILDQEQIDPGKIAGRVFCPTHRLLEFFQILVKLDTQITLLSSQLHGTPHSDYNVHQAYLDRAPWPKIEHWYARNLLVEDLMVSPLPIGILVNRAKLQFMQETYGKGEKRMRLYANFEINSNHGERDVAHSFAKRFPGAKVLPGDRHYASFQEYILDVRDSRYVLCPPGSGLDTWRLWETLYMGSVPIVKRSPMTEYYADLYPMVLIDFWEELLDLPPASVPEGDYRKRLSMGFWKDLICA